MSDVAVAIDDGEISLEESKSSTSESANPFPAGAVIGVCVAFAGMTVLAAVTTIRRRYHRVYTMLPSNDDRQYLVA